MGNAFFGSNPIGSRKSEKRNTWILLAQPVGKGTSEVVVWSDGQHSVTLSHTGSNGREGLQGFYTVLISIKKKSDLCV